MPTLRSLYFDRLAPALPPFFRQRAKIFLLGLPQYAPILTIPALTFRQRLALLLRCLRIDWCVQHAHWPGEAAHVLAALGRRPAKDGEVFVEAGCWQGGSTAKWSILCAMLGYRLHVYDSFEGCEATDNGTSDDWFAGQYAAAEELVRENVRRYGEPGVCTFIPGWFSDTLAASPVEAPVRGAYIDCDLSTGTREALQGILPTLVGDGFIATQDWHLTPIREVIHDPDTWEPHGATVPILAVAKRNLALFLVPRLAHHPGSSA